MTLRNDVVLVVLPKQGDVTSTGGLILAHGLTPPATYGKVYKVGPKVKDVQPGDVVAFPPSAGHGYVIGAHDCLFLRESEILTRIETSREPKDSHV